MVKGQVITRVTDQGQTSLIWRWMPQNPADDHISCRFTLWAYIILPKQLIIKQQRCNSAMPLQFATPLRAPRRPQQRRPCSCSDGSGQPNMLNWEYEIWMEMNAHMNMVAIWAKLAERLFLQHVKTWRISLSRFTLKNFRCNDCGKLSRILVWLEQAANTVTNCSFLQETIKTDTLFIRQLRKIARICWDLLGTLLSASNVESPQHCPTGPW